MFARGVGIARCVVAIAAVLCNRPQRLGADSMPPGGAVHVAIDAKLRWRKASIVKRTVNEGKPVARLFLLASLFIQTAPVCFCSAVQCDVIADGNSRT